MIKKVGLIALLLFSLGILGHAQMMNLTEWSGTKSSFKITDIRKITFSNGNMTINGHDNYSETIALIDICHANFTGLSTGVYSLENIKTEIPILFPNPVHDNLSLNYKSSGELIHFEVLTMDGKIVYRNVINIQLGTNQTDINVTSLPKGIYLFRLVDKQVIQTLKFMKY
jgi:hypothetical protein